MSGFLGGSDNLIENKSAFFIGGAMANSATINTYTTAINITSACIITGISFSTAVTGVYTIKITIDGGSPVSVNVTSASNNFASFSIPMTTKCLASFKVEVACTIASTTYSILCAHAI